MVYKIQCVKCGRVFNRAKIIFTQECPGCEGTKWNVISPSVFVGLVLLFIGIPMIIIPISLIGGFDLSPWVITVIILIGSFMVVVGYAITTGERDLPLKN